MTATRSVRVGYVWQQPDSPYTTYGVTGVDVPARAKREEVAELVRVALEERFPGAETTFDHVRRLAKQAIA